MIKIEDRKDKILKDDKDERRQKIKKDKIRKIKDKMNKR